MAEAQEVWRRRGPVRPLGSHTASPVLRRSERVPGPTQTGVGGSTDSDS